MLKRSWGNAGPCLSVVIFDWEDQSKSRKSSDRSFEQKKNKKYKHDQLECRSSLGSFVPLIWTTFLVSLSTRHHRKRCLLLLGFQTCTHLPVVRTMWTCINQWQRARWRWPTRTSGWKGTLRRPMSGSPLKKLLLGSTWSRQVLSMGKASSILAQHENFFSSRILTMSSWKKK